jgi:nucleoside-diphosphate kinase
MKEGLEQTLVLIKPDALRNSLTGYVLSLLSEYHTGLVFAGVKIVHVTTMLAAEHYAEHRGKIFYASLIDYITGAIHYPTAPEKQRVVAIIYQGPEAVTKLRAIAGPTNPHQARDQKPGCIRALGTVAPLKNTEGKVVGERMDNLIHASATDEEAQREVKLWFRPSDIPPAMHAYTTRESGDHFYFKNGRLLSTHEQGSVLIAAPGDIVWESDLSALEEIRSSRPSSIPLDSIVAKYLINR